MGRKIAIVLVLSLALILRLWKLDIYPEAIDEDEMSLGYMAYSILHKGTDEHGNIFPIYFESVGDYKYGLYSYFSIPAVYIFGLSAFSTRITAVIFGVLSVYLVYLLTKLVFKNENMALITMFVLAVNPMHIHFSRVGYSNIFGSLFVLMATYLLIRYFRKQQIKFILGFIFVSFLSIYSYQAYRIILPLVVLGVTLFSCKLISFRKAILINLTIFILVSVSFINPKSISRSQSFSVLVNKPRIIEEISEDGMAGTNFIVSRMFHNKVLDFSKDYLRRYLSYFNPEFLFLQTSVVSKRHSVPNTGMTHLVELPLVALGVYALLRRKNDLSKWLPFVLVFASPIPASLVLEDQSTTRVIFMVYGLSIVTSYGISYLLNYSKKTAPFLIITLYFFSMFYFYHNYTVHKVYHHPWNSDVGLKEMVKLVNIHQSKYDKVVVSKNHYIPFLFYNKLLEFPSNIVFGMPTDCPEIGKKKVFYVCFGYKLPESARLIEIIRFRDGQPAILLIDFNSPHQGQLPERVDTFAVSTKIELDEDAYWPDNISR